MDNTPKPNLRELARRAIENRNRKKDSEVLKTSDTPTPQTPSEKAKAVQRKTDNKYIDYVTNKLLPSLD